MTDNAAELIAEIRRLLTQLESSIPDGPNGHIDLDGWLNLHLYPRGRNDRHKLARADEQLSNGYTYEQIVQIFRWQNKTTFLPLLKRFCDERSATWTR